MCSGRTRRDQAAHPLGCANPDLQLASYNEQWRGHAIAHRMRLDNVLASVKAHCQEAEWWLGFNMLVGWANWMGLSQR
jgi:hypothetical protein